MAQGLIVDVTKQKLLELQLKDANRTIKEQNKKLAALALTDPLTGLSNRRSVKQILDFLFDDFKRTGTAFSILMLDLDNFKKVNDNFGHDAGDDVLKSIAKVLKENLRAIDIKARWGGEEFLAVFPHTGEQNALIISHKILSIIRSFVFTFEETRISVTFSGGICTISDQTSLEELIKKADTALYKAKTDGRNRIIVG